MQIFSIRKLMALVAFAAYTLPGLCSHFDNLPALPKISSQARFLEMDGKPVQLPRFELGGHQLPLDMSNLVYRYLLRVLSPATFRLLNKSCYNLVDLRPGFLKPLRKLNVDIGELFKGTNNLRSLDLSACLHFPFYEQRFIDSLKHLKSLTTLLLPVVRHNHCKLYHTDMIQIGRNCPTIENLNFSTFEALDDQAYEVVAAFPNLSVLTFDGSVSAVPPISGDILVKIVKGKPTLEKLKLLFCNWLYDETLESVVKYCPSLTSLNLYGCDELTEDGLLGLRRLEQLTSLNLSDLDFVSDEVVVAIAEGMPLLRTLNLVGCDSITLDSIEILDAGCLYLEKFRVNSSVLPRDSIEQARWFPCLKEATLFFNMGAEVQMEFIRTHPDLARLSCHGIRSHDFSAIAPFLMGLTHLLVDPDSMEVRGRWDAVALLRNLRCLTMMRSKSYEAQHLVSIAMGCQQLTEFSFCVPDLGMEMARALSKFHGLKTLYLRMKRIGAEELTAIAGNNSQIRKLTLYNENSLENADMLVFSKFPYLSDLSVKGCDSIDYDAASEMLGACVSLTCARLGYIKFGKRLAELNSLYPRVDVKGAF